MPLSFPSHNSKDKIKKIIYALFSIDSNLNTQKLLFEKTMHLLKYDTEPRTLFKQLLQYLENHHIPLPAYTTLQTLIGNAIASEEKRLMRIIEKQVPSHIKNAIDDLLTAKEGLYPLSALKKDPRNFRTHQVMGELKKHIDSKAIFKCSKMLLPLLNISTQNITYYASLAMYYDIHKLSQFTKEK